MPTIHILLLSLSYFFILSIFFFFYLLKLKMRIRFGVGWEVDDDVKIKKKNGDVEKFYGCIYNHPTSITILNFPKMTKTSLKDKSHFVSLIEGWFW